MAQPRCSPKRQDLRARGLRNPQLDANSLQLRLV